MAYGDCVTCPTQTPSNTPTPTQTPTQTQTPSNSLAGVTISVSSLSYPTCYNSTNGSITVIGGGGNGDYQFRISYGSYTSTWEESGTFSYLGTTSYTLTARDTNMSESSSTTVNFGKSAPSCTINVVDPQCYGGTGYIAVLNPLGGNSGAYTVKLNDGTYQSFPQTYYNLGAGDYTITVRDTSGCEISYPRLLSQPSSQSSSITSVVGATSGDNGSLTISSSGGVWNKTYRLYKDSASPYNDYPTDNLVAIYTGVTSGSPSISVTGLACGYYWLHVTDANGCVTTTSEYQVTCPAPAVTYYQVELRSGQVGDNNDYGSACYNFANGALMDVVIYTETGAFTDGYQAYTDSSGNTLYTGVGYYTDGSVYGRIQGGTISHYGLCGGGPMP